MDRGQRRKSIIEYSLTSPVYLVFWLVVGIPFCIWSYAQQEQLISGPISTSLEDTVLSTSSRLLVLRLPPPTNGVQEQILVHSANSEQANPGRAIREAVDRRADYTSRRGLTTAHWQQVQELRQQWCMHPPSFSPPRQGEVIYLLALRCGTWPDIFATRIAIPEDDLPAPLRRLLARVPSPDKD